MTAPVQFDETQTLDAIREAQRLADLTGARHAVQANRRLHLWEVVPLLVADPLEVVEICRPVDLLRGAA